MPDLFCGKAAVGGNYNLMRDILKCLVKISVIYETHIETDLSNNSTLIEFLRKNPGREFEVMYVLEDTIYSLKNKQVMTIRIRLH